MLARQMTQDATGSASRGVLHAAILEAAIWETIALWLPRCERLCWETLVGGRTGGLWRAEAGRCFVVVVRGFGEAEEGFVELGGGDFELGDGAVVRGEGGDVPG